MNWPVLLGVGWIDKIVDPEQIRDLLMEWIPLPGKIVKYGEQLLSIFGERAWLIRFVEGSNELDL